MKLSQIQLNEISNQLTDKLDKLLEFFKLSLRRTRKMYVGCCPIHGGDNESALNIYYNGDNRKGHWICYTQHCEQQFVNTIIGFVRGLLSKQRYNWSGFGDKIISFNDTLQFIYSFLKINPNQLEVKSNTYNHTISHSEEFIQYVNNIPTENKYTNITRNKVRQLLKIPSEYYLKRGYSSSVLDKYDVGLCVNHKKPMYNRVVVPIYDNQYRYLVGCTGRTLYPRCSLCKMWHPKTLPCPTKKEKGQWSKWKHSHNFKGANHLYNYWFARKYIAQKRIAILVESPGNVWRLQESGIYNSVGLFGNHLSSGQEYLLNTSGALTIYLLLDNDNAGYQGAQSIIQQLNNKYYIHSIKLPNQYNDVGDMTVEQINNIIKPQIKESYT